MTLVAVLAAILALGFWAEVVFGVSRRAMRRSASWSEPLRRIVTDVSLARRGERASTIEAIGVALAGTGAMVAGAAAAGSIPGSAGLLAGGLATASMGVHLTAGTPRTSAGDRRARDLRLAALLGGPALILAVASVFLRWRAGDFEAIAGAQMVLGPGIRVGPSRSALALVVSGLAICLAIAAAFSVERGEEEGAGGGPGLAAVLGRWLFTGSAAVFLGASLWGPLTLPAQAGLGWSGVPAALGVAALAATLVGLARSAASLGSVVRWTMASLAIALAAAALSLVVLG